MLISVINGLSVTDNEGLEKKIMSLSLKLWKIAHFNYFDNLPICTKFFFQGTFLTIRGVCVFLVISRKTLRRSFPDRSKGHMQPDKIKICQKLIFVVFGPPPYVRRQIYYQNRYAIAFAI